jgi:hypothetical protein
MDGCRSRSDLGDIAFDAERRTGLEPEGFAYAVLPRLMPLVQHTLGPCQHIRLVERDLDSNATMTALALPRLEQRLGRRIVQMDYVIVQHVEHDHSE